MATARDPSGLDDLVKKYGDKVRTISLDVADEAAAHADERPRLGPKESGRVDVALECGRRGLGVALGRAVALEQRFRHRVHALVGALRG